MNDHFLKACVNVNLYFLLMVPSYCLCKYRKIMNIKRDLLVMRNNTIIKWCTLYEYGSYMMLVL